MTGGASEPDLHTPQRGDERSQKNPCQRAGYGNERSIQAQARLKCMRHGEFFERRMDVEFPHANLIIGQFARCDIYLSLSGSELEPQTLTLLQKA